MSTLTVANFATKDSLALDLAHLVDKAGQQSGLAGTDTADDADQRACR